MKTKVLLTSWLAAVTLVIWSMSKMSVIMVDQATLSLWLAVEMPVETNEWYTGPSEYRPTRPQELPPPLTILEQYKQWHAVEALERHTNGRQYALALYGCPHSAGNRFHTFMNHFLWAILQNRTLLLQFLDADTCERYYVQHWRLNAIHCDMTGEETDCQRLMRRAEWIPVYQDWRQRLNLPEPYVVADKASQRAASLAAAANHTLVLYPNIPKMGGLIDTLMTLESSLTMHQVLSAWGPEFMYGALFRYAFDFDPSLLQPERAIDDNALSIGLHSRHGVDSDDGCDIAREVYCLETLLADNHRPCQVAMMSDRQCTNDRLTTWLEAHQCTVIVADHAPGTGTFAEHGPFAGTGYFQDLAVLTAQTRSAFIGSPQINDALFRSSSQLVLESIEFSRRMQHWREEGVEAANSTKPIIQCMRLRGDLTTGRSPILT